MTDDDDDDDNFEVLTLTISEPIYGRFLLDGVGNRQSLINAIR